MENIKTGFREGSLPELVQMKEISVSDIFIYINHDIFRYQNKRDQF
jgi:hypothetical protein